MVTMGSKKEYVLTVKLRYENTKLRSEKSKIIDEVVENLERSRKHVIKILNGKFYKTKRRRHVTRRETYPYKLKIPLEKIWIVGGKRGSKNLKPQIPELIKKLKKFDEIDISKEDEKLLCKMSTYVIDRFLGYIKKKYKSKGISGTKRSPLLKDLIPIRTNFNEIKEMGHVEQDCVLHCGNSVAGRYAETLNTLDIHTHWNEQTAFLKKTKVKVVGAFNEQRKRFPFEIKSVDFDNGHEFVNWSFYEYCKKEGIDYTRSRPYHKNDQAHIEGKNWHTVRRVIGYERIEDEDIVDLVNDIYKNEFRLLNNFFYATRKLIKKEKVNKKWRKKYDEAKTPYRRVIDSKEVKLEVKVKLMKEYNNLNPAELERNLTKKIRRLGNMISVSKTKLATTQE